MKFLEALLSEKSLNEIKAKLGEDLTQQVNDKLAGFSIDVSAEKMIPKVVYDTDKAKLRQQVTDRDNQLTELRKSVKDNEELTTKIAELEKANKEASENYEKSLVETKRGYALNNAISGAKAKNIKALEALLDKGKITYEDDGNGGFKLTGFSEQIEALKKSDSYLFEGGQNTPNPQNPPKPEANPSGDPVLRGMFGLPTEEKKA